jgi:3-methylcrotonyl-CoA carboxylase alpha subunit
MPRTTLRTDGMTFEVDVEAGRILVDGVETAPPRHAQAVASGEARWVFVDGEVYEFDVQRPGRRGASAHHASLSAPMPATVRRINVVAGARVSKGDTLLVLEAMKMELPVRAPDDGVVTAVSCKEGDLVQPGTPLLEVE